MRADEKRFYRLEQMLRFVLQHNPTEDQLYAYARNMGVAKSTAWDYVRAVEGRLTMMRERRKKLKL